MAQASAVQASNVLDEVCARNVSVELHAGAIRDRIVVSRTRILHADDETLYLDKPRTEGRSVAWSAGDVIDVHFSFRGKRYCFRSRVRQAHVIVNINATTRVRGISIVRPASIDSGQRRSDFRVSVASYDPIVVCMHDAPSIRPDVCPIDAGRFAGRLVNISVGGASVRVGSEQRRSFQDGDYFFISFSVPGEGCEQVFLAELRHARRILDGDAHLLGLQFQNWPEFEMRSKRKSLSRIVTDVERKHARRR
jgi:c-di-GMP-binding flagellar brake protein YcgR